MLYEGKYSLKKQLLTEAGRTPTEQREDGWYAQAADGQWRGPFEKEISAIKSAASQGGSVTQTALSNYLASMGHTGVNNKTGEPMDVPYSGKGARDVDIRGVDPKGVEYIAELGRFDKVLQLGAMNADGTFKGTKPKIQKAIADKQPGPYYLSEPMAIRAGLSPEQAATARTMFKKETVLEIWLNCGDDLLIYDAGDGSYKALALTDKGATVDFGGKKIRKITVADCIDAPIQSSGGGSIRAGINAFDTKQGGVKVENMIAL